MRFSYTTYITYFTYITCFRADYPPPLRNKKASGDPFGCRTFCRE